MYLSYSVQEPQSIGPSRAYVDAALDTKMRDKPKIYHLLHCPLWRQIFFILYYYHSLTSIKIEFYQNSHLNYRKGYYHKEKKDSMRLETTKSKKNLDLTTQNSEKTHVTSIDLVYCLGEMRTIICFS